MQPPSLDLVDAHPSDDEIERAARLAAYALLGSTVAHDAVPLQRCFTAEAAIERGSTNNALAAAQALLAQMDESDEELDELREVIEAYDQEIGERMLKVAVDPSSSLVQEYQAQSEARASCRHSERVSRRVRDLSDVAPSADVKWLPGHGAQALLPGPVLYVPGKQRRHCSSDQASTASCPGAQPHSSPDGTRSAGQMVERENGEPTGEPQRETDSV